MNYDKKIGDILEDLMVGHNWDYAHQQIKELLGKNDYNAQVGVNCILVANSNIPAEWTDPVSGRKLYNDTYLEEEK